MYYIWMRGLCLFPFGEGLSIHQLTSLPTPALQSTLNKCGHSGHLVVYFVWNLLPSCWLTWHIINSYKDESAICTLCLWIGSEVAQPLLAFSPLSHMNYSQHGREGHHFEMWPGQQITFCFGSVVKVNVSQVWTRVMYSWLSHFADWMTRQIVSTWCQKKRKSKVQWV